MTPERRKNNAKATGDHRNGSFEFDGGADILQDINFEVYENEILGLIGPNGAGKTTLMECLANLRPRTSGEAACLVNEGDFNKWLNDAKKKYATDSAAHDAVAAARIPAVQ